MSYVALLVIFGDKAGHWADLIKTVQYSRFFSNRKTQAFPFVTACSRVVAACCETRQDSVRALGDKKARPKRSRPQPMIPTVVLLGLAVGVLVGLLGIGGGVVLVPALVYLLHMDQHLAQGTSLLILLPPVGLGALREYWKQGQVDLRAGLLCAFGILAGGYLGGLIAVPLDSRQLKGLFGCFLMLAAFLLWRKQQPRNSETAQAVEDSTRD
ncbi:MAG: sulfite exporter TauE/SafE family protein [Candidatus Acidiferrum sp.]